MTNVALRSKSWTKRSFQEPSKKNSSHWPAKERQTPMQDRTVVVMFPSESGLLVYLVVPSWSLVACPLWCLDVKRNISLLPPAASHEVAEQDGVQGQGHQPTRRQCRRDSILRPGQPQRAPGVDTCPHFLGEGLRMSVPPSSAATRQKTSETRYLHFKWLCEACDTNCLS